MFSILPSLICADLLHIEDQIRELQRAGASTFHIDVMDGHFVPNLGLNFDLVRRLRDINHAKVDVHLMVESPEQYLQQIDKLHIEQVSFHIETTSTPLRIVRSMKATGARTGIALSPLTPIQSLQYVLDEFDFVLLMTVEPGFAGQKFIPSMYGKIRALRKMIDRTRPDMEIEVDGNLDVPSSLRCIHNGATILVGGTSSIFRPETDVFSAYVQFQNELRARL
jgi:ribulose-phosphate 3-epimerase